MTKVCTGCNLTLSLENFHRKSKGEDARVSMCKTCKSARASKSWSNGSLKKDNYEAKRRRVLKAQDYLWSVLVTTPCMDCGEDNPVVLEFDHVRGEKRLDISKMVSRNYGVDSLREEVAKCDVVCANCHKIRTSTRGSHWRVARLASEQQSVVDCSQLLT